MKERVVYYKTNFMYETRKQTPPCFDHNKNILLAHVLNCESVIEAKNS